MASFTAQHNGLVFLRISDDEMEKIRAIAPKVHQMVLNNPVRARGTTKPFSISLEPTWQSGLASTYRADEKVTDFEIDPATIGIDRNEIFVAVDLNVEIVGGKLTVISGEKTSFSEAKTTSNKSPCNVAIMFALQDGPLSSGQLRLKLSTYSPPLIERTLTKMLDDGRLVQKGDTFDIQREGDKIVVLPGSAKVMRVFRAKKPEEMFPAEHVSEQTGQPLNEVEAIIEQLVSTGSLFKDGNLYALPTRRMRLKVTNAVGTLLMNKLGGDGKTGVPAPFALITMHVPKFHPYWIKRILEEMIAKNTMQLIDGKYHFLPSLVRAQGSGVNRITKILREAEGDGVTADQFLAQMDGFPLWALEGQLAILVLSDKVSFDESDETYHWKVESKTGKKRHSFRDDVLAFLEEHSDVGVDRETINAHFGDQSHKVTVALNELLARRKAILRNGLYRTIALPRPLEDKSCQPRP